MDEDCNHADTINSNPLYKTLSQMEFRVEMFWMFSELKETINGCSSTSLTITIALPLFPTLYTSMREQKIPP